MSTPDSFFDGGRFVDRDTALAHARRMIDDGADIIDVGGESTRPGAKEVGLQQELDRVIPVIEMLAGDTDTLISIDSSKPEVFEAAAHAGADLINDVRALQEPGALEMAVSLRLPVCLMHMQGSPRTMQASPDYAQVADEVAGFLRERLALCVEAGLAPSSLMIDPGFGFGKTLEHNLQLLRALPALARLAPVLTGLSRKRMIGAILARGLANGPKAASTAGPQDVSAEGVRIGSVAAAMLCVRQGASLVRVHDVAPTVQALAVQHAVDFAPHAGE